MDLFYKINFSKEKNSIFGLKKAFYILPFLPPISTSSFLQYTACSINLCLKIQGFTSLRKLHQSNTFSSHIFLSQKFLLISVHIDMLLYSTIFCFCSLQGAKGFYKTFHVSNYFQLLPVWSPKTVKIQTPFLSTFHIFFKKHSTTMLSYSQKCL